MNKNHSKGENLHQNGAKSSKDLKEKNSIFNSIQNFIFTKDFLERNSNKVTDLNLQSNEQNEVDNNSTKQHVKPNVNSKKNTKKSKTKKGILITVLTFVTIAVIAGGIIFIPYLSIAYNSYEKGFDTSRIDIDAVPHIYDRNGNEISIMYGYFDSGKKDSVPTYSSVYVDISTLPKYVSDTYTAIEDETFYDNMGISINRLFYATFNYLVKGDSSFGGSTITQQLIKISTGDDSHSPSRKAREIGSAIYLTDHWPKEKILSSYMNLVYYGNGAYGIYEASFTYFDTEPKNLNLAQAAVLAALPNSPEGLNPYSDEKHKEKLLKRQQLVLRKMLELSLISQKEYDEAINFKIEFSNGSKKLVKNNPAYSQYLRIAMKQAVELVAEKYNYSYEDALNTILNGRTKINLNMDPRLQTKVYEIATSNYTDFPDFEVGSVITTKSGEVLALVSSRTDSQIDHAYKMTRQTGSAIKPISVYSPAFNMGLVQPNTYIYDGPLTISNGYSTWHVHNADNSYRGNLTVTNAVAYSLNTPAVRVLQQVTLNTSLEYVKSFGITTVDDKDLYYPALALGGLTRGISPFELTQAYNVFNNDGVYRNISTIKSLQINGDIIVKDPNEHQVISKDASDKMKIAMNAVGQYGTARTAVLNNVQTYLKTGTTNDTKDIWTCGFTNEITSCMWGGYDTPRTINMYNVNKAWKESMEAYYNK